MRGNAAASRDRLQTYAASYAASRELRQAKAEAVAAQLDAAEARASKAAFLSGLNHELRTPLNHITGFAGLLRQAQDLPLEKQAEYLDNILGSAGELLRLIDAILDAAAGKDQQRAEEAVPVLDPLPVLRRLLFEHSNRIFVGKLDIADELPLVHEQSDKLFQALQRIMVALILESEERRVIGLSVQPFGPQAEDVIIQFSLISTQQPPKPDVMRSVGTALARLGLRLEDQSTDQDWIYSLILTGEHEERAT